MKATFLELLTQLGLVSESPFLRVCSRNLGEGPSGSIHLRNFLSFVKFIDLFPES